MAVEGRKGGRGQRARAGGRGAHIGRHHGDIQIGEVRRVGSNPDEIGILEQEGMEEERSVVESCGPSLELQPRLNRIGQLHWANLDWLASLFVKLHSEAAE